MHKIWINKFWVVLSELNLKKINTLSKLEGKDLNKAKIISSNEVIKLCHEEENAKKAEEVAKNTFEKKSIYQIPDSDIFSFYQYLFLNKI